MNMSTGLDAKSQNTPDKTVTYAVPQQRVIDGILGLCVGDALGVPVEFISREQLRVKPVTTMQEYGTYNRPRGTWSDDSSMTLCLFDCLSKRPAENIEYTRIMDAFSAWIFHGEYTPYGDTFDYGRATQHALLRYRQGTAPLQCGGTADSDNGNGSLMRILPMAFWLYPRYGTKFFRNDAAVRTVHAVSSLTHAHPKSLIACAIYTGIACNLLGGISVGQAVRRAIAAAWKYYEKSEFSAYLAVFQRLHEPDFKKLPEHEIQSSGYVVHTLEAALWCLLNTRKYASCVLKAVNLGADTDTTAAVAGGLAGLAYGSGAIPEEWRAVLARREWIEGLCR